MPHGDPLQPLLTAAGVSGRELGTSEAKRLWSLVDGGDGALFDEFLEAIAPRDADGELPLRVGQWRLDLAETGVRTGVLTALVAGALIPQGLTEFAVGFVTAVLPSVLEIERIELEAGDQRLLVELRSRVTSGSEDALYEALPPETRAVINRYDFADFVARLREAGFAKGPDSGTIRLRSG
jgi:hypothetical protein